MIDVTPRAKAQPAALRNKPTGNKFVGPAIILVAAAVATAPLFVRGPACGSDLGFHLVSWIDAQHSITMGVPYPHWANSPNFGAGEPRFVFYPPLSWTTGAFLGLFLPWTAVPVVFCVILLAANGLANRALARQALADGPATLAGCASIFLGYPLFSVYKRCDFAELGATACIPLLLLYALCRRNRAGNFWQRTFDGSAAPLALVMAVTWLCNGPVGLMACYLLAAIVLVSAMLEKSLIPVVRAGVSTALGVLLASVYLVPAVWEKKWASIEYATTLSHFTVENSWLFARHDYDATMISHDMLLHRVSLLAVIMLVIALAGCAICWLRKRMPGKSRWWIPLALIPVAVLLLLFPISEPVWATLPWLRLLQFPWRWLLVLETPVAIFFAAAVWLEGKKARTAALALCGLLFAGISLGANSSWFVDCGETESSIQQMIHSGMGTLGKPEYAPPRVQFAMVDRVVHSACLLDAPPTTSAQGEDAPSWDGEATDCNSNFRAIMHLPEEKHISGIAEHAGFLILRLRYYPAWRVTVNGSPVTAAAEQQRGFMAVPVAAGPVRIDVEWTTMPDAIAGRWLTVIALASIVALYLLERKLRTTRL